VSSREKSVPVRKVTEPKLRYEIITAPAPNLGADEYF
jgi:hypothetical protein